jgi:3-hydroxyisobutyrate dehydrogenase-like beta-hydroxyacid dehydrogenase
VNKPLVMAVLGLGEAGSAIATDLIRAGVRVCGYDPIAERTVEGLERKTSEIAAIENVDIILSVNWASVALDVAQAITPRLQPHQLYADLNTASPKRKQEVASMIESTGATFADVALMSPVPGRGIRTPSLVSGSGAVQFTTVFSNFGMPVTNVGNAVGTAAARKLLRSVFFKGLAAAVGESLEAAQKLGWEKEVRENIAQTLNADDAFVTRLVEGSRIHAKRRREEMAAAAEMLEDISIQPLMARATEQWLLLLNYKIPQKSP